MVKGEKRLQYKPSKNVLDDLVMFNGCHLRFTHSAPKNFSQQTDLEHVLLCLPFMTLKIWEARKWNQNRMIMATSTISISHQVYYCSSQGTRQYAVRTTYCQFNCFFSPIGKRLWTIMCKLTMTHYINCESTLGE